MTRREREKSEQKKLMKGWAGKCGKEEPRGYELAILLSPSTFSVCY